MFAVTLFVLSFWAWNLYDFAYKNDVNYKIPKKPLLINCIDFTNRIATWEMTFSWNHKLSKFFHKTQHTRVTEEAISLTRSRNSLSRCTTPNTEPVLAHWLDSGGPDARPSWVAPRTASKAHCWLRRLRVSSSTLRRKIASNFTVIVR